MERRARITFQDTVWAGEHDGYSIVTSAHLWVEKGRALSAGTLGKSSSEPLSYEVLVERIVVDRVGFAYRNLVIKNPDGTVNLSAPRSGRFILSPGDKVMLATPVMDAGMSVTVTLDEIR